MKTFLIILMALSISIPNNKDEEAINSTLNYYMEGSMNRDFNTLKEAFHEDAIN